MVLVGVGIAWLDLQAHSVGMIDMGLMGAALGGGVVGLFTAIAGRRSVRRR